MRFLLLYKIDWTDKHPLLMLSCAATTAIAGTALVSLLTGCQRTDIQAQATADEPLPVFVYRDKATGCEYVTASGDGITPRIAADGKSHMGCKGVAK